MRGKCGICGKEAMLELISSGCAPVSYEACGECLEIGAEDIDVAALWVHLHGGAITQNEHLTRLVAWLDGGYVDWIKILEYYENNRSQIIEDLNEEYFLEDLQIDPDD